MVIETNDVFNWKKNEKNIYKDLSLVYDCIEG